MLIMWLQNPAFCRRGLIPSFVISDFASIIWYKILKHSTLLWKSNNIKKVPPNYTTPKFGTKSIMHKKTFLSRGVGCCKKFILCYNYRFTRFYLKKILCITSACCSSSIIENKVLKHSTLLRKKHNIKKVPPDYTNSKLGIKSIMPKKTFLSSGVGSCKKFILCYNKIFNRSVLNSKDIFAQVVGNDSIKIKEKLEKSIQEKAYAPFMIDFSSICSNKRSISNFSH